MEVAVYYGFLTVLELAMIQIVLFGYLWEENRITKILAYLLLVEVVIFKAYLTGDKNSDPIDLLLFAYGRIILVKIGFYLIERAKAK